jgi:hypothetical protein
MKNEVKLTKQRYIDDLRNGQIVAFQIEGTSKAYSGMVEGQVKDAEVGHIYKVRSKLGVAFTVRPSEILWVKTGDKWPKGVFKLLRGETYVEDTPSN